MSLSPYWEGVVQAGAPREAIEEMARQDDMLMRNLPFWREEFPNQFLCVVKDKLVVASSWIELTDRLAVEFPGAVFSAFGPSRTSSCGGC